MFSAGSESLLHQARSADLGPGPRVSDEAGEERGGGGPAARLGSRARGGLHGVWGSRSS